MVDRFKISSILEVICRLSLLKWNDTVNWIQGTQLRKESKKTVVQNSQWLALVRCGIHLISMSISIFLISLNLRNVFIGVNFQSAIPFETINAALLQVAAKIQELLIVSSLATIIFHLVRDELIHGDGLPLGLLGAGIDFNRLNYFCSKELWGSWRYKTKRKLRKVGLLAFLVSAGAIATPAGPSCAVLLLPHTQSWPAGGTEIYLNGTKDDFWPSTLTGHGSCPESLCTSSESTSYGICPSGGFHSIRAHYMRLDYRNFFHPVQPFATKLSGSSYYWPIESAQPIDTRLISLGGPQFLIQPHAGVSVLLEQVMHDWWEALISNNGFQASNIGDRAAVAQVLSPITHVKCATARNMSYMDRTLSFSLNTHNKSPHGQNISIASLNQTISAHSRFSWVQLSAYLEPVTVGAVFESPWSVETRSRVVVGCTIQANWVPTQVQSDAYTFWRGWYPWNVQFDQMYPAYKEPTIDQPSSKIPNGAIAVDDSWLALLTPRDRALGPSDHESGPSTIESILTASKITEDLFLANDKTATEKWINEGGQFGRSELLEAVICSVFEDGLARVGSHRVYNIGGPPSSWTLANYIRNEGFNTAILKGEKALKIPGMAEEDMTKLSISLNIGGLSYRASLATYLAMVVLCLHIAFALAHTIWTLWRGETSTSWDSITKYIALAQNSQPAFSALENTAAGITRLATYSHKAVIRPTNLPGHSITDHLELVFEEKQSSASAIATSFAADGSLRNASYIEPIQPSSVGSHLNIDLDASSNNDSSSILLSSTWPLHRRPSIAISSSSRNSMLSQTSTPLLTGQGSAVPSWPSKGFVKVGHEYG